MTKKSNNLEVYLRNDWYDGGTLLRSANNPHFISEKKQDLIPDSAKVKLGDDKVLVADVRKKLAEEANEEVEGEAETEAKPAGKKTDLKL